jgi:hypothetical protein
MAARGVTPAGRGTNPSRRQDAGSHSVDRIVGLFSFGSVARMPGMMPHNQDADTIIFLTKEEIVWKSFKIDSFESANPYVEMLWMF